ncbi:MAG TPA: hypothetical protein VNY07_13820 [Chthoniobacterales bacterium]|jgi:hypothetical protein|nr:hypothetical protein [Chthoniobacterales bacterium]
MAIEILRVTERDPGAKAYDFNIVATEKSEAPRSILSELAELVAIRRSVNEVEPEVLTRGAQADSA